MFRGVARKVPAKGSPLDDISRVNYVIGSKILNLQSEDPVATRERI